MPNEQSRQVFRFGPRDKRALVAGIRSGQLFVISVALVVAVGLLHVGHGRDRGILAFGVIACGFAIACLPVSGRTLEEWIPVLVRYLVAFLTGTQKDATDLFVEERQRKAPSIFRDFAISELPANASRQAFGVMRDFESGTWSAVLSLGGDGFALVGHEERLRRTAAWAAVLAAAARDVDSLFRIQWIERTSPESGERFQARFANSSPVSAEDLDRTLANARRSYASLLAEEATGTVRHEIFVVISVKGSRRRGSSSEATGPEADRAISEMLTNEVARFVQLLHEAGLELHGVLSQSSLQAVVHRGFAIRPNAAPVSWPWPVALTANWSSVCTDGTWHATYWIAEWPRNDVGPDFLAPLLMGARERRTLSVVMAPVPPLKAMRRAERATTSGAADAELRRRHGFTNTARTSREREAVLRRESELADGHAAYRFSGYVTVTGVDRVELERACSRVEQVAAMAHLELRRLYGMQLEALCCTLPIGRGCS